MAMNKNIDPMQVSGDNDTQGGGMNQMAQDPMAMLKNNPQALAYIQSLSPEDQEAYMSSLFRDYKSEGGIIDERLNVADELRDRQTGQGVSQGGQFVAQSPLSGIANIMNKGNSAYKRSQALDAKQALADSSTSARMNLGKSLMPDR